MRKFISMIFIILMYTGMSFGQDRVTVQAWANSVEYVFGSASTTETLTGGSTVDTLSAVVRVGDSHFFTLFFDVTSPSPVVSEPDSTGFGIYYAPNWDTDATVNTESNFNYWKIGDTAPKLIATWTPADTCNNGQHYVSFNFPASTAMPVNAAVEILLISTVENDTTNVKAILNRGR